MDAPHTPVTIRSAGRPIVVLLIALLAVLVSVAPALAATPDITPTAAPDDLETPDAAARTTGPGGAIDPDDLELAPPGPDNGPVLRTQAPRRSSCHGTPAAVCPPRSAGRVGTDTAQPSGTALHCAQDGSTFTLTVDGPGGSASRSVTADVPDPIQ